MVLACGPGHVTSDPAATTSTAQTGDPSTAGDASAADTSTTASPTTASPTTASPTAASPTSTGSDTTRSGAGTDTGDATTAPSEATGDADTEPGEASSTGESVEHATIYGACGPNDWAVLLKLAVNSTHCMAAAPDEFLWVFIFQPGPLSPGVYPLGEGLGHALHQTQVPMSALFALTGEVVVEAWDDAAISGTYHFVFEDASERSGAFAGPLCWSLTPPCD